MSKTPTVLEGSKTVRNIGLKMVRRPQIDPNLPLQAQAEHRRVMPRAGRTPRRKK